MILHKKFKKILKDIKRRPEDVAKELNIDLDLLKKYLDGESLIPFDIVQTC